MKPVFRRAVLGSGAFLMSSVCMTGLPAQAQESLMLEEVVVTARKREESMQDVPVAVSAFSGEALREAGVGNVQALTVPGLQIDPNSSAQIWIRGVGQRDDSARIDSPVGVYIDGVYIARRDAQLIEMLDPESVQVLRGPQGTLFGKNTTAGALVVNTRKPSADFGGYVQGRIGDYGRRDLKAVLNLPLVDNSLYSKISLGSVKRDGYLDNVTTGQEMASEDRLLAALQLRWLASDTVTVDTFGYFNKTREVPAGAGCRYLSNPAYGGQQSLFQNWMWAGDTTAVWPLEGLGIDAQTASLITGNPQVEESQVLKNACQASEWLTDDNKVTSDPVQSFELDNLLVGVNVDWAINDTLSLKSITSYGDQELDGMFNSADNDGAAGLFSARYRVGPSERQQVSQEFQLNGEAFDGRLQYTAGLFGMVEDIDDGTTYQFRGISGFYIPAASVFAAGPTDFVSINFPTTQFDTYELQNTTLGVFFQGSYDVTNDLQLTLGARWTSEKRETDLLQRSLDKTAFNTTILNALGPIYGPAVFPTGPLDSASVGYAPALIGADILSQVQALFPRSANGAFLYPMGAPQAYEADKTWTEVTPMASLSYTLPDTLLGDGIVDSAMTYFTYSEGFKSGTFEPFGTEGLRAVDPEIMQNFEVGVKLDGFNRQVRLNTAIYHMKYDDMQLRQVQFDSGNNPVVVLTNASKSTITGAEIELTWQPLDGLMVQAGGSYNDYDYKEFTDVQFSTVALLTQQPLPVIDRSSEGFAEVPERTFNLTVQYDWQTDIGTIRPRVDYRYASEIFFGLDAGAWNVNDRSSTPSHEVIDARVSWIAPDTTWEVAAWVTNLTDEEYLFGAAAVGDSVGTFFTQKAPPRMVGLDFIYRFGAY